MPAARPIMGFIQPGMVSVAGLSVPFVSVAAKRRRTAGCKLWQETLPHLNVDLEWGFEKLGAAGCHEWADHLRNAERIRDVMPGGLERYASAVAYLDRIPVPLQKKALTSMAEGLVLHRCPQFDWQPGWFWRVTPCDLERQEDGFAMRMIDLRGPTPKRV